MLHSLRGKLTYANVMVTILAFIVLGGGAYAATHLKKNSVGTDQLKKSAVVGSKIKDRQVTPKDLARPGRVRKAGLLQNPSFNCANAPNQWASSRPDVNGQVGYYRDIGGTVHLVGDAALCGTPSSGAVIFVLPSGYRPSAEQDQAVVNNASFNDLTIDSAGRIFDTAALRPAGERATIPTPILIHLRISFAGIA